MSDDTYEIYAVRYAHHDRKAPENYIGGDPHDILQPLDYFVWAIKGAQRTYVVDTGFDETINRSFKFIRWNDRGKSCDIV